MHGWTAGRRNRALLIVGLLLIVLGALWLARGALFPYILALVLAYLMLPAVNRLDVLFHRAKKGSRLARPLAIVLVYLLSAGLVVLFFSLVFPVVGVQFKMLWSNREDVIAALSQQTNATLFWYRENVPADIQVQVEDLLQRAAGALAGSLQAGVARTLSVVTSTASFIIGMAVVPFWLFYVLHDQVRAARSVVRLAPKRFRADFLNLVRITDSILGAYLRGQLLLCVFIGAMATAGLMLLGVRYAAVLGLVAGVFEILPFIGPILGLVPAVLVAAIQDPWLGLWTLVLFIGIQQAENLFLVPRISGRAVKLHPAVIMVVLVVGNEVAGLWGMLMAVPLTAIIRDLFRYLYMRLQDDPVDPQAAMTRLGRETSTA